MIRIRGRKRKIIVWAGTGAAVLVAVALALMLLLPVMIDLRPMKNEILAALSQRVEGQVEFQKIDLSFFPRPRLKLRQGKFSLRGFSGTVDGVAVYPRILPLLKGKIRLDKVEAELPRFHVDLPQREEKSKTIVALDRSLCDILGRMKSAVPGLSLTIKEGEIILFEAGKELFRFEEINAHLVLPPERLKLDVAAKSNLWERISLSGWVDAGTLDGRVEVDLLALRPQDLTAYFFSDLPVHLGDSRIDLNLRLETAGCKIWKGQASAAIPHLTLSRGPNTVILKGKTLKGAFYTDQEKTSLSLDELDLLQPQLHLSGLLDLKRAPPQAVLELTAKKMDIGSTRRIALALAPGLPTLEKIFEILKGGKSDRLVLKSKADSLPHLPDLRNLQLSGNISQGRFYIPGVGFELQDVEGEATLSEGVLTGKNLKARLENAIGQKGTLKLGLKGGQSPFHLDISIRTGLGDTSILRTLIKDQAFQRELSLVKDLNGNASGRLILGETIDAIKARVEMSAFSLTGQYQRIPFPLAIKGGQFFYEPGQIRISGASGRLGTSSFSQLSTSITWKGEPYLEVSKGEWRLSLNEIYPWISSFIGPNSSEDVSSLKGSLLLNILDLKGDLLKPKNWDFRIAGSPDRLLLHTPHLPAVLSLLRGTFEATRSTLSVRDLETGLFDTSLKVTGIVKGYLSSAENADLSFQGRMDRRLVRWFFDKIKIPPEIKTRGPFAVSSSHLIWEKGKELSLSGEFMVGRGPKVSLEMIQGQRLFNIRRLFLEDELSQALFSINSKEKMVSVHFKGFLHATTLDRLVENPYLTGWVRGELQVDVNLQKPVLSAGQGRLDAEGVLIPGVLKTPLNLQKLQLSAEGHNVRLASAKVVLGEIPLSLSGDVNLTENQFLLHMALSAQEIKWEDFETIFKSDEKDRKGSADIWSLPLRGKVDIALARFRYKDFLWSPVRAELSLNPKEWVITVQEATTCEVSTLGFLRVSPQGFRQEFTIIAKDQPLGIALNCLLKSDRLAAGIFEVQGRFNGLAGENPFLQSVEGDFRFTARKGRIYRFTILSKVFALLDVTEILKGKLPELTREGLPFDILRASGDVKNGILTLKRGILDGPSMKIAFKGDLNLIDRKMDLVLLVVPFKTLDDIIRHIPLLGRVLGKTFTSIPVRVVGDFENPTVVPLSASAVGSELLDFLQRTLGLPLRLFEILIPAQPSEKK